jgi:hypothetical protein
MAVSERLLSVGSAVVLAALTLSVFVLAQNRGPESSFAAYLEAIASRDSARLQRVSAEPVADPAAQALASQFAGWIRAGARVQTAGVEQDGRRSVVRVVLTSPRGELAAIPVVLVKPPGRYRWLVSATETWALLRSQKDSAG